MEIIEMLMGGGPSSSKESHERWNSRTVESIADTILERISDNKPVVGTLAEHRPRLMTLTREFERNTEFASALKTVAGTVLALFPNDVVDAVSEQKSE